MSPRKVLIVEDHAPHADTARRLLEDNGYAVRVVEGGTSGLEAAQTWGPDAILMDASLPGMSGLEAVSLLRSDVRTQAIPVIATTVRSGADDFARGFLAGFATYLTKPLSGPRLLETLDELITARARRAHPPEIQDLEDFRSLVAMEDREQILAGLLEGVRRRVPCDVLALRCQDAGMPHVLLSLASPVRHSVLLGELAPDLGIDPRTLARLRVVASDASEPVPAVAPSVRARMTLPLSRADEPLGVLVLGSFSRDAFDPADERVLGGLSATLSRVCCRGLRASGREPAAETESSDIDVGLLLPDTADMIFWQGRIETSLPGLRVHIFASPDKLADSRADLHVALVAPMLRAAAESALQGRVRQGQRSFTVVELRPEDVQRCDELLRSMLMMALLAGFGDGRRTGRLRIADEDGMHAGEISFRHGRVEWAARDETDVSLLGRLAERAGTSRRILVRAIHCALDEGRPLLSTLVRENLVEPTVLRAVLRDYLATIMRELLRLRGPVVSLAAEVPPPRFDAPFELGELALGLFDA